MMNRAGICLAEHSSQWDKAANATVCALRRILAVSAADVRHIGSTAMRGIVAVPVLDIAVVLYRHADTEAVLRRLEKYGYKRLPRGESPYLCMQNVSLNPCRQLWIMPEGSREWQDILAFRDYLNNHVFAANEYEALKKKVAAEFPDDTARYEAEKAAFFRRILRLSTTDRFLGRNLTIVIDRPAGKDESPEDSTRTWNEGYVPGILDPGGREQRAYIYGIRTPLRRFTGTVIAVAHRRDDDTDTLIVAPTGMIAYEPQIAEFIREAEAGHSTAVVCIYEKSCGAILYRSRADGEIEYLVLYQHRSGTWSIPKGHIAAGETERETALREIREETGLTVSLIDGFRRELSYTVSAKATKNMVVFLAQAQGELALGENEISDFIWAEKQPAIKRLGGRSIGRILEAADLFIRSRSHPRRHHRHKR